MTQTAPPHSPPPTEQLKSMTFGEHLLELRRRIMISIAALVVAMLAFMFAKGFVTDIVMHPYRQAWGQAFHTFWDEQVEDRAHTSKLEPEDRQWWLARKDKIDKGEFPSDAKMAFYGFTMSRALMANKVFSDVFVWMSMSMLAGLIVAAPMVLYQMWQFIAAGLYHHERRMVTRYLPLSVGLFMAGVLFGYYVMIPFTIFFLVGMMEPGSVQPLFTVGEYFSFLFSLTGALGAVFQLPLVMMVLTRVGIVPPGFFTKYWRHAVVAIFLIAGILTPPDPFTQSFVAVPMVALYVMGIFLSKGTAKKTAAPH